MKTLFDIKKTDRIFYNEKIRDFLPGNIIDIHAHIWKASRNSKSVRPRAVQGWPSRVADRNPVSHLIESYKLLLPGKNVTPVVFGSPTAAAGTDGLNLYVSDSALKKCFPALMLSRPEWTVPEFFNKLSAGKFIGAKPYLSFAPSHIPPDEIRIFDFIPRRQLDILNSREMMLMLHIPRPGRLSDPLNLAQLMEIENNFPRIKMVIAHAGRAYCPEDIGGALEILKRGRNMMFDISANTNADVFRKLIKTVGPERVLFGSDLPITRMRMRRVCRKGIYVNIVPAGLYGDVSGDRHMEEAEAAEAEKLTFFLYEQIHSFMKASKRAGLLRGDVENVFFGNACRLLEKLPAPEEQLRMELSPEKPGECPLRMETPRGYYIRTFTPGDEADYISLMRAAGFEGWDNLETCLNRSLPRGIFFAIHRKTGKPAGTCSAWHNPSKTHPSGGELAWLGVHPSHRGRRLGKALCAAVINRFYEAGYARIYLNTDDFRLPAVKTYLELGFSPFIPSGGMKHRWGKIFKKLGTHLERSP